MNSTILNKSIKAASKLLLLGVFGLSLASMTGIAYADKGGEHSNGGDHRDGGRNGKVLWVNHFDLQSADTNILTTGPNDTSVSGNLTGLVVQAAPVPTPPAPTTPPTPPVTAPVGPSSLVMALDLPNDTKVTGVKVCYDGTSASYIDKIALAQVQGSADMSLTTMPLTAPPADLCVVSKFKGTGFKTKNGAIVVTLGVHMAPPTPTATPDPIIIREIGVLVK
jgi:hypothetical protein